MMWARATLCPKCAFPGGRTSAPDPGLQTSMGAGNHGRGGPAGGRRTDFGDQLHDENHDAETDGRQHGGWPRPQIRDRRVRPAFVRHGEPLQIASSKIAAGQPEMFGPSLMKSTVGLISSKEKYLNHNRLQAETIILLDHTTDRGMAPRRPLLMGANIGRDIAV